MNTEIVEGRVEDRFGGLVERAERAEEMLRALLRGGYRTAGMRDTIGEGILLHHDGDGPDLVLYPDGSLHPVGAWRQPQLRPFTESKPKRGFRRRLAEATKWMVLLALASSVCMLSLALWATILEGL